MTIQSTDAKSGWFRFLHHDQPIEWSGDVEKRLANITAAKPPHEQSGRIAMIRRVPDERVPLELVEARRVYDEAGRAYTEAGRSCYSDNGLALARSLGPFPLNVEWNAETKCLIFL